VSREWIYAALVVLSARWWWPLFQTLRVDLRRASDGFEAPPSVRRPDPRRAPAPLSVESRTPLVRVLAFRGVARRVAARRRWQGGFGRRGL
jgi:hypothetical protein